MSEIRINSVKMASRIRSAHRDAGGEGVHGGDVRAGAGVIDRGRHNSLRQVLQHVNTCHAKVES